MPQSMRDSERRARAAVPSSSSSSVFVPAPIWGSVPSSSSSSVFKPAPIWGSVPSSSSSSVFETAPILDSVPSSSSSSVFETAPILGSVQSIASTMHPAIGNYVEMQARDVEIQAREKHAKDHSKTLLDTQATIPALAPAWTRPDVKDKLKYLKYKSKYLKLVKLLNIN